MMKHKNEKAKRRVDVRGAGGGKTDIQVEVDMNMYVISIETFSLLYP